jgi:FkbM family methyltransferase
MSKWTERAALWWGYRFRPAPCVVKLRSGRLIRVNPTDHLQLMIYYFGTFEPHALSYLKLCASRGGTIIDVGANIGLYTLEGSLVVGPAGRVISIEAAPSHVEALRENIKLNGIDNVSIIESAVGDSTGIATLTRPKDGNFGMFTVGLVDGDETCNVPLQAIDGLLADQRIESVDLIKMDIEGSEYRGLRGAERTLKRYKPTLLIELNETMLHGCKSSTREVKDLLREMGYRGWQVRRKIIHEISETQVTHICDECLFVHRDNKLLMERLRLL